MHRMLKYLVFDWKMEIFFNLGTTCTKWEYRKINYVSVAGGEGGFNFTGL